MPLTVLDHQNMGQMPDFIEFVLESENMMDFVRLLPKSEPGLATFLHFLALELYSRYKRTERTEYLDRAILMGIEAIKSVSKDNPNDTAFPNHNIAKFFLERFECKGSLKDLDSAVGALEHADTHMQKDNPHYMLNLGLLGSALHLRFNFSGLIEDLNRAIELKTKIFASNVGSETLFGNSLGRALEDRFKITGEIGDLNHLIALQENGIKSTPNDETRFNLAATLQLRFNQTESIDDLDRAINLLEDMVKNVSTDDPKRVMGLESLAFMLELRFDHTNRMDDLNRAIDLLDKAMKLISKDDTRRPAVLDKMGNAFQRRFRSIGSMEDLKRAIVLREDAVNLSPNNHPEKSMYLNNLAGSLKDRFDRTGLMDDLNRAIILVKDNVKPTSNYSPSFLNNLATLLLTRFESTASMDDVNQAIALFEQCESLLLNKIDRDVCLGNLGTALSRRCSRTGSMSDLDAAIVKLEQAVASFSKGHRARALYLGNLGNALIIRSKQTSSMDDYNRAIAAFEQSLLTTPNDPAHSGLLNDLANALQTHLENTRESLDRIIRIKQEALNLMPIDHPSRAMRLSNLASALRQRFEQTNALEDLDQAIALSQQAVASTTTNLVARADYLSTLGTGLLSRYNRKGLMEDLDNAIVLLQEAIELTPKRSPDFGFHLMNFANALKERFEKSSSMKDLEWAIATQEQALELISDNHIGRATCLTNLGLSLHSLFKQTWSMKHIDRAVEAFEQAVASRANDHPEMAEFLTNLASALEDRFEQTRDISDFDRAVILNEQSTGISTARPSIRISAAKAASQLLLGRDNHRAKTLLRAAVHLLPSISPRELSRTDQQYNISQFVAITPSAVSLCVECDEDPYTALQLLEIGRGVLASFQMEVRSDVSSLKKSHPDFAQQFQNIRDQIDRPHNNMVSNADYDRENRRIISKQFDSHLGTIRQLDGHERFLLGPSESEIKRLAETGPIVVFNVSEIRSDAFLVSEDIRSLPLPLLKYEDLKAYATLFLNATSTVSPRDYANAKSQMNKVLEWLWDVAVHPVLDQLGFTETPGHNETWPRVWWVGSGLLNLLPIHAAGYHESGSQQNAMDRVISSYTPTIKALAYARERSTSVSNLLSQKVLLVAMSTTPAQADLPFVEKEMEGLRKLVPPSIQILTMSNPTKETVMSALPDHQIVHMSCHGYSSSQDPSQSMLLLEDWKVSPLTVSDLISMNIQLPQFAFLSACHMANTKDIYLLDESINVVSAIQLAGYPSVVGTMWYVTDIHCPEVAKSVYSWMLVGGKLDTRRSAEGLHRAVRALRDRTRDELGYTRKVSSDPLVWASYVHWGI